MRSQILIILTIFLGLLSCDKKKELPLFNFPVILDTTLGKPTEKVSYDIQTSNYRPLYIGTKLDTIAITYPRDYIRKFYVYANRRDEFYRPDSSGVKIYVDYSTIISDIAFVWLDKKRKISTELYKAYPVIISNSRQDTIEIGYGEHIPLITEALDPEGNWRPIEDVYTYMCGVGLNGIILPPNNILLTATPIYKGAYKTKMRLRYHNIVSDEYSGTINLKQFEHYKGS